MSTDQFVWGQGTTGSWNVASNWSDMTTGQTPASLAPAAGDYVTINPAVAGATHVISGAGTSAALTIQGPAVLAGQFTTGSLTLPYDSNSTVLLNAGASLNVTGNMAANYGSSLTADSGAFAVAGTLSLSAALNISGGTAATIGGALNGYGGSSTSVNSGALTIAGNFSGAGYDVFTVANGSLTIGGSATTSNGGICLEIDSGGTLSIAGSLSDAPYSVNEQITSGHDLSLTVMKGGQATIGALSLDNYDDCIAVDGGALSVSSLSTTTTASCAISVQSGGTLSIAGNAGGGASEFNVTNAALYVGGALTGSTLVFAFSGGRVLLGGLGGYARLTVDNASSIEIGSAGGAPAGAIVIDPGVTISESGIFGGPSIVDNGTIVPIGNLSLNGALAGYGQIQIGNGADLTLQSIAATSANAISFTAAGGVLSLSASALGAMNKFLPVISGFGSGDVIYFQGTATSGVYSGGTFTLANGATTVASFTLTGAYLASQFVTSFKGNQAVISYAPTLVMTNPGELPNVLTQTLAGTIDAPDANLTITIHDGATWLGTTTANSLGAWSVNVALSGGGPHVLTVSATDAGGATAVSSAQALAVGSGQAMNLGAGSGSTASLYDTAAWDLVVGSGATIYLSSAQAGVSGGGNTLDFVGGWGDAATVANTGGNWDTVNGSSGIIYLASGQASVTGGGDSVIFSSGSGNAATLSNTVGNWDSVYGSGGTLYLASAQAGLTGGGDTVNFTTGSGNALSVYSSGGAWVSVNGANGTIYLISGQAAVTGGGDSVNFSGGAGNATSLYNTSGAWDAVNGSGGTINFIAAQAGVTGGGDTVNFTGGSGNAATLCNTDGNWDAVNGSSGIVYLINGQAVVTGGGDTVDFIAGSGNAVSLYGAGGAWDAVNGSGGTIDLVGAQAGVNGGGDTVNFISGSGNAATVYATAGAWDSVNGSNGTVYLVNGQAVVTGGGDIVNFAGGSGNAATLSNSGGSWDEVNGSGGTVSFTSAQAAVTGGGDTIAFVGGAGNVASLYATGGVWDTVNGSDGTLYLFNAQAGGAGSGDTLYLNGANSVTLTGASDAFVFQRAIGLDTIYGFASTDSLQFSAFDFANWSALQSHASQSGANTLISLDASDTVTLAGVAAASLVASQFKFV